MQKHYTTDFTHCPTDTYVWVICNNYNDFRVAKLCSHCSIWSDQDGIPIDDVNEWKTYLRPSVYKKHKELDKLINNWLDENYDEKHKKFSIRKHLDGAEEVGECLDYDLKCEYYKYLNGVMNVKQNT